MDELKKLHAHCRTCNHYNRHTLVAQYQDQRSQDDDFRWWEYYQIITCDGCDTPAFRKLYTDELQYDYDTNKFDETITIYPSAEKIAKEIEGTWRLPEKIRRVYQETVDAINRNSLVLGAIGIRVLIESICDDRNCKLSNDLPSSLHKLKANGYISEGQYDTLMISKDLLNKVTHEAFAAPLGHLKVALSSVDNMLEHMYIHSEDRTQLEGYVRQKPPKTPTDI